MSKKGKTIPKDGKDKTGKQKKLFTPFRDRKLKLPKNKAKMPDKNRKEELINLLKLLKPKGKTDDN